MERLPMLLKKLELDIRAGRWARSVGDYNNDGWPDLLVTCLGGVVLYRNNGDGTFTDVTKQPGLSGDTHVGDGRGIWRL
jgi:hypothetical protein